MCILHIHVCNYIAACMCNEHGDTCNRETGRCNCHTKGVTGDHCERCDTQNNYVGDPLHGSCFCEYFISALCTHLKCNKSWRYKICEIVLKKLSEVVKIYHVSKIENYDYICHFQMIFKLTISLPSTCQSMRTDIFAKSTFSMFPPRVMLTQTLIYSAPKILK